MSNVLSSDLALNSLLPDDSPFVNGMRQDKDPKINPLNDPDVAFDPTKSKYAGDNIDGVLIVAGNEIVPVNLQLQLFMNALGSTTDPKTTIITEVTRETGNVRPEPNKGKEQ